DGEDAAQNECPLPFDDLAQANGGHNLQNAGDDGPGGDEDSQHRQRGRDEEEHHHAEDNAQQPFYHVGPPAVICGPVADAVDDGEDAVYHQVGRHQQHQYFQGETGKEEGEHGEDDRRNASN